MSGNARALLDFERLGSELDQILRPAVQFYENDEGSRHGPASEWSSRRQAEDNRLISRPRAAVTSDSRGVALSDRRPTRVATMDSRITPSPCSRVMWDPLPYHHAVSVTDRREAAPASPSNQPLLCVLCRSNGEPPAVYTSHQLKDSRGRVRCPVLYIYTCPVCGASGPHAHTVRYCPRNADARARPDCLKTARTSCGRRRRKVATSDDHPCTRR